MVMSRRFGLYVAVGALSLAAAPAHASHIPGATYRGTAATGGTVELDVSADGAAVTRLVATDVRSSCGVAVSKTFTGSLPIVNHAFSSDPTDLIRFEGSFPAPGQASGALLPSLCPDPAVSWAAATDAAAVTPPQPDGTAPDGTAPALNVRARRSQRLGRGGRIRLRVGCPAEACRVVAGGSVSLPAARLAPFRLKPASAGLARGGSSRLEPRLGRRALEAALRALRGGRRVRVAVEVSAVDAAGNRSVERLSIRLRARR
jgi:hypothetical protein